MDDCENSQKADSLADLGVKVADRDINLTADESPTSKSDSLVWVEESSGVSPSADSATKASTTAGAFGLPVNRSVVSQAPDHYSGGSYALFDGQATWPRTRKRQILNLAYFSVFGALLSLLSPLYGGPYFSIGAVLCFTLAAASGFYLMLHRSYVSCDDELPAWARRSLRSIALIFPVLIMGAGLWIMPPQTSQVPLTAPPSLSSQRLSLAEELALADKLYDDENYGDAVTHYNNVVAIDPRHEHSYARLSDSYLRSPNFNDEKSIASADQALKLNRYNDLAASSKAWALNNMHRYAEALPIATAVTERNSSFGEAFASIANAQRGLHNYAAALKADNVHVRLHDYEGQSYRDRAETLEALGRNAEAKADLARAEAADAADEADAADAADAKEKGH